MSLRHVIVVGALLLVSEARAGCTSYASQGAAQIVSFGDLTVARSVAVGQVIAERVTTGWTGGVGKCTKPRRTAALGIFSVPTGIGETYATNVPGIGIRVFHHGFGWNRIPVPDDFQTTGIFSAQVKDGYFAVQLVKTSTDIGSGAVTNGTIAQAGFDNRRQIWVDLMDTRIVPEQPTCGFVSKKLLFDLGDVDGGALHASGHSGWASQSLVSTGCSAATEMMLTFSGRADPHDANLFRLDGESGAAAGVAVELRADAPDQQVLPNSAAPLRLPAGTEGRLYGFRARYRTTGAPLSPGPANLSITVDVAYR